MEAPRRSGSGALFAPLARRCRAGRSRALARARGPDRARRGHRDHPRDQPLRFVAPRDTAREAAATTSCTSPSAARSRRGRELARPLQRARVDQPSRGQGRDQRAARGASSRRAARRRRAAQPERDALTLFDEGGVVVARAPAGAAALHRRFRWKELFWARRARSREHCAFVVFGHALLEKMLDPYIGMVGQDRVRRRRAGFFAHAVAECSSAQSSASSWITSPIRRGFGAQGAWRRCRCWAARMGSRAMRAQTSTTTCSYFRPGDTARRRRRMAREAGQTVAVPLRSRRGKSGLHRAG